MSELFTSLLTDLVADAIEAFDGVLMWMLSSMLRVETLVDTAVATVITDSSVRSVYTFIYAFAFTLVILKFLFKGFQVYILWRDGDADSSPQDMLIGAAQAVIVMASFPYLYNIMADITLWFAEGILERLGLSTTEELLLTSVSLEAIGLILLILLVVYLILAIILCVKLIQRGFELLVLRLGVPIACLGLVDSDLGLFRGYIQTFLRTLFTSVIQITLMSLSLRVIVPITLLNLICGIAVISTALSAPVIMQQILVATGRGGGGITNKIYSGAMAARALRGLVGK